MDLQEFENIFKNIKEEYIKIIVEKKSVESFINGERAKVVYEIELKDAEMYEGEVIAKKDGFVFDSFGKYSNFAEYKKPNKEIQKKFLNKLKSKIGSHSQLPPLNRRFRSGLQTRST